MNPLKVLYEHWIGSEHKNERMEQIWAIVNETVAREVAPNYQVDFISLLSELSEESQFYGFSLGFYTAMTLWKELEEVHKHD